MIIVPTNETELVILFAQTCEQYGFEILKAQVAFPDAIVRYQGVEYNTEFEFNASNFWSHKHDPARCDLIICWNNNDPYSVLPIIALSETNWFDANIAIISDELKLTGYWRNRALIAESKLTAINNAAEREERILARLKCDLSKEQEDKIVELSNNGFSYRAISKEVYGGIGSYYNRKIDALVRNK